MYLCWFIWSVALVAGFCPSLATAADWPMWRCDARRSGGTPVELADELHLQWSRQLPPPRPAWPNEPRLHFDAAYEPVVLDGRMFVGSPNDGSLASFDVQTGEEYWRFFTDGPVRLAPVAWQGKVFFGSDDGYLYCLQANTGTLLWKVRGAPDDRPVQRHLGNGRLVSFWPVRGGPVLADGTIYFAAGIWPTLGVFVHAVDAETGDLVWTNSTSHQIPDVRIDHNYLHEAGISPQGHLLVVGDLLVVPNGRSFPARLERRTGERLHYVQGYRNGDSRVSAMGSIALVGDRGVLNLQDGREIGSRWVSAGDDVPDGWDGAKKDLFEGPMFPYLFLPGCTYRSVLSDGTAYGMHQGTIYAYDLQHAKVSLYEKEDQGKIIRPARWDVPLLWKLNTGRTDEPTHAITIRAGNRIYTHTGNQLLAVNLPHGQRASPSVAWSQLVEGPPGSMLSAAGKLIVVTAAGQLHCFGAEPGMPRQHPLEQATDSDAPSPVPAQRDSKAEGRARGDKSLPAAPRTGQSQGDENDPPSETTAAILKTARADAGYAVVLGLRRGQLVEELLSHTKMNVIVADADPDRVNALRRRLAVEGPYDNRFQALVADPASVALPPYLASLIVADGAIVSGPDASAAIRRLYRVLRPYGGVACLDLADDRRAAFIDAAGGTDSPNLEVRIASGFVCLRRTGALPGAADWTHQTADAARTFFSPDQLVKAPLAVLWYGDGKDHGFYKRKDYGHGVKPQVAGGRLFALQVATRTLHAVDAYTGRLLWTRKLGPSPRYASFSDGVYVASGRQCEVFDPGTGSTLATFAFDPGKPPEVPVSVSDVRVDNDVILLAVRFNTEEAIGEGRWESTLLVALDRHDGQQLWTHEAAHRFNSAALAMGDGQVFCADSHSPIEIAARRRRGEQVGKLPSTIFALDSRSGDVHWKVVHEDPPANLASLHFIGLRAQDNWLAYSAKNGMLLTGKADATYGLDAASGQTIWRKPLRGNQPLIVGPQNFVNQAGHTYAIRTGDLVDGQALFRRGGCNYAVGGRELLLLRAHCAAYVDRGSRQQYNLRNLRSGCSNSLIAADGLLCAPCFSVGCVCNYPIQTSFAMRHMPEALTGSTE